MVEPVAGDWTRVAERVKREMDERGWLPNDVYRVSKVDPKTLDKLLAGGSIRNDVARRLSKAFGWRDDGIARVRAGEEPVGLDAAARPPWDELLEGQRRIEEALERIEDARPDITLDERGALTEPPAPRAAKGRRRAAG